MVKRRRLPRCRRVTGLACLTEVPRNVVRILCSCEIRTVALITVREDKGKIVVDVACLTGYCGMSARECKLCCGVVERGAIPRSGRMALHAICRIAVCLVIGIGRPGKIRAVALIAIRVRDLIIVVHVTSLALHRGMETGERELGGVVIEERRLPRRRRVAHRAILWKSARLVIGVCRCGKIRAMAIHAVRGKSSILVVHMARVARQGTMSSRERK